MPSDNIECAACVHRKKWRMDRKWNSVKGRYVKPIWRTKSLLTKTPLHLSRQTATASPPLKHFPRSLDQNPRSIKKNGWFVTATRSNCQRAEGRAVLPICTAIYDESYQGRLPTVLLPEELLPSPTLPPTSYCCNCCQQRGTKQQKRKKVKRGKGKNCISSLGIDPEKKKSSSATTVCTGRRDQIVFCSTRILLLLYIPNIPVFHFQQPSCCGTWVLAALKF